MFKKIERSRNSELMDDFDMSQIDLNINLLELETINKWLGGYNVSFDGFSKFDLKNKSEISVVDVGCGGGDGMISIQKFLDGIGVRAKMIGIDANPKAIEYAKQRCLHYPDFEWISSPFQKIIDLKADVWHCSLFAHHFYDDDLNTLIRTMNANSNLGFIINDLQRHWFAYHSISILTRLFSKSHLVKNDARLSVAKGFSRQELMKLLQNEGIQNAKISWKWAFRWQVVVQK